MQAINCHHSDCTPQCLHDMATNDSILASRNVSIHKDKALGRGSYGVVYLAHWNEVTCAAKVIHETLFVFNIPGRPNMAEQLEKECEIIKNFRHPNIVQFLDIIQDPDTMFPVLLMELMEKSLTSLLEEDTSQPLPYHTQISICHDVSLGVTYLHSMGFIHRDISSNNILMKGQVAKLTDLGVSVLMNSDRSSRLSRCPGTEVYMPPDSIGESPEYTCKIDCFSFGVLGLQILTRLFPKPSLRYSRVVTPVQDPPMMRVVPEIERRKEHLDKINKSHPLLELLYKCLRDVESERPSAQDICRFVARLVEIEKYEAKQRKSQASSAASISVTDADSKAATSLALENATQQIAELQVMLDNSRSKIAELNLLRTEEVSRLEQEMEQLQRKNTTLLQQATPIPNQQVMCVLRVCTV